MRSWIMLMVICSFFISSAGAQDNPKNLLFDRDERTFFVPPNYSPIRTVRLRFHPSEPKLLAQVSDKRLTVWDLNARPQATKGQKEPRVLPESVCEQAEGWITGFDVHPSGKWIVTGGSDRQLRRWAWKDAKPVQKIVGHDGWIEAVAYSPDGRFVATGGADLKVKIWDAESLRLLDQFSGHTRFIRDLAWTPKGDFLCTGGEDGKVLVYDVPGKRSPERSRLVIPTKCKDRSPATVAYTAWSAAAMATGFLSPARESSASTTCQPENSPPARISLSTPAFILPASSCSSVTAIPRYFG